MKANNGILMGAFALFSMLSCKKENQTSTESLEASKTTGIKKTEMVIFESKQATGTVQWSASPATDVVLHPNGNKCGIAFGRAGTYEVKAISSGKTAVTSVQVTDIKLEVNTETGTTSTQLTGDQIAITPSKIDSSGSTSSTSGLILNMLTSKAYSCLNNYLKYEVTLENGVYTIDIKSVEIPSQANCAGGEAKSYGFAYLYPLPTGNTGLKVKLNGTIYTGNISKTGNSYQITWPSTTGVTFTKLIVN